MSLTYMFFLFLSGNGYQLGVALNSPANWRTRMSGSREDILKQINDYTFDHYAEHTASIRQWLYTDGAPS